MGKENAFKHPVAQRFSCTKCGLCCGNTNEKKRNILLLEKEASQIAIAISKPISVFADKTEDKAPYIYEIKKSETIGTCFFLQNNKCLIYPMRPLICRFYPFELKRANDRKYEFSSTNECPGMNKGRVLKTKYYAQLFRIAQSKLGPDQKRQKRVR